MHQKRHQNTETHNDTAPRVTRCVYFMNKISRYLPRPTTNILINTMTRRARQAASLSPPRRITRSSLARFAYNSGNTAASKKKDDETNSPDIEDIIPDQTLSTSRKRKRAGAASIPASRKVKGELDDDGVNLKLEVKSEEAVTTTSTSTSTSRTKNATTTTTKRQQQRKPARKTMNPSTGELTVTPPTDWEETYNVVKEMRFSPGGAASNAPVDTMGCERLALSDASPRDQRFQTLVALMLSSQTKDTVNAVTMRRLQTELPAHSPDASPGLNLENILACPAPLLNELIYAVGFHNNKTKYLQQAAAICRDKHGSDIPDTIEGLVALPGVGPKMAHLCLSAAWDRTEGIGVDVHVHRITNLWGWHGKNGSKNPEDTRVKLEGWLPRDKWREINTLLVGLGQTVCLPVGRRCGDCDLGLKGLCRAAEKKKVLEGRKRVRESVGVVKVNVDDEDGVWVGEVKGEDEIVEEREKEVVVNEKVENRENDIDRVKKEDLDT